jgi:hypothetical protein
MFIVGTGRSGFERGICILNLTFDLVELLICWFHYFFPIEENVVFLSYVQMFSIILNVLLALIQLVKDFKLRLRKMFQMLRHARLREKSSADLKQSTGKSSRAEVFTNPLSKMSSTKSSASKIEVDVVQERKGDVGDDDEKDKDVDSAGGLSRQQTPSSLSLLVHREVVKPTTPASRALPPLKKLKLVSSLRSGLLQGKRMSGRESPPMHGIVPTGSSSLPEGAIRTDSNPNPMVGLGIRSPVSIAWREVCTPLF